MTAYAAPLADMRFVLNEIAGLPEIAALPGYAEAEPDLVDAVLEEAAKLASGVLAPLNQPGDQEGCSFENGVVRTPAGFRDAYREFVEGGWNGLPFDPAYGGQGLPWSVALAVQELWQAANMSFGLCPLLTQSAVELLQAHGSAEQKAAYLSKLITGEWSGTMNLTEPQAGSDVGAAKTRAVAKGDHYLITGQKIYITYGEHDLSDNIVHMVLARTPDAPPGTKGVSLFIVPKLLPAEGGGPGPRNDLRCVSIEHKLGIRASPTAVMAYGDDAGAVGYLVGEENRGMHYMFTMMNNARVAVGLQGLAIAERAYQQARNFARERIQGRRIGGPELGPVRIIEHPDVRRMLATMKAYTESMRALVYLTAGALDRSKCHPDESERNRQQGLVDLLTPVTKAWCTDVGCEVASIGVQVHGGMGFIEETGAEQHYRDARIAPIYEGTNGIQALDLVSRKLARDEGEAARALIAEMKHTLDDLRGLAGDEVKVVREALGEGLLVLSAATDSLLEAWARNVDEAAAAATPYLRAFGTVAGGWLLARSAAAAARHLTASEGDERFLRGKLATARFYSENLLPLAAAHAAAAMQGSTSTLALHEDQF